MSIYMKEDFDIFISTSFSWNWSVIESSQNVNCLIL